MSIEERRTAMMEYVGSSTVRMPWGDAWHLREHLRRADEATINDWWERHFKEPITKQVAATQGGE